MSDQTRAATVRTSETTRRDVIAHMDEADTDLLIWGEGFMAALCYLALTVARHFAKCARFDVPAPDSGEVDQ